MFFAVPPAPIALTSWSQEKLLARSSLTAGEVDAEEYYEAAGDLLDA